MGYIYFTICLTFIVLNMVIDMIFFTIYAILVPPFSHKIQLYTVG